MMFNESPRRKQINELVAWGHWFTLANIIIALVISSVYLLSSPKAGTALSITYMMVTWFGHISFITFFGFILLLLPFCYIIKHARLLKALGSVIASIGLALLAFDALLFNKTGFHISFSSAELLKSEAQGQMGAFNWLQWFYLILLIVIWLMFQLILANAIFKRIKRFMKIHIGVYVTSFFVSCFVVSHAIHVWADARLYAPVLQQDNMLPLSYPATAKTLMSRIGMLDLQAYRQRQNLQFNDTDFDFKYPPQPIYCSVDASQKVLFIALNDNTISSVPTGLVDNGFHFVSNTLKENYLNSVIYGLPEVLLPNANDSQPVVLALSKAFNLDFMMFDYQTSDEDDALAKPFYSANWDDFRKNLSSQESGLFLASVNKKTLDIINLQALATTTKILFVAKPEGYPYYKLFSNLNISKEMSTTEDIAPTILNELGCQAAPKNYSIGQALQSPTRSWAVSTQGRHLVVIHNGLITEVSNDGSFEIRDYMTNEKVLSEIDTNLLSRSIKHITEFSKR